MTTSDPARDAPGGRALVGPHRCRSEAACQPPAAAPGSRRRRLWELDAHAHCPVIGVCLPLPAMRRLAHKVLGAGRTHATALVRDALANDYELHCGMVAECRSRSRMAEAVQRELDRRHMLSLRRAASAKTPEALAAWWLEQGPSKDLPGALWATLTHPRCTPAVEHEVLGQVHMLQHQVGLATRVELARFEALIDENAVLSRALGAAQRRSTRQAAEHATQAAALQADVVRLRGQHMAAQSGLALLRDDLQSLRAAMPDLDERAALAQRGAEQAQRIVDLQRALQQARADVERLSARAAPALSAASMAPADDGTPAAGAALAQRAVLCVGGRTSSVPVYRRLIEASGGRFLHHDGGDEDSAQRLDATLAAADLVICQAGCVSHDAYWRVKDHCKRTGKRCVFVDTPSAAGLQRALADLTPSA